MKKTNKYKLLSWPLIGASAISLIATTACTVGETKTINVSGSSTVYPFISNLSDVYTKINNDVDIITTPNGSGSGIKEARDLKKDFGIASRFANNKEINSDWVSNEIKTFTFAWDGIAIVYYAPGLESLNINKQGLIKLYEGFAGYKKITFADLDPHVPANFAKITVKPYARSGGAAASGTAEAFLNNSQLVNHTDLVDETFNNLETGNYGKNTKVTAEANSQAFQRIDSDRELGSIIYLSAGFVETNMQILYDRGFRVASIGYDNYNVKPFDYDVVNKELVVKGGNVARSYRWFRPLNIIFSVNHVDEKTKDFLWWVLTSDKAEKIIKKTGGIPLTDHQKLMMFFGDQKNKDWLKDEKKNKNFFFSDLKVFKINNSEPIDLMGFYQSSKD
ncbi:PstS family phosphate ABC transporter substrate-binding protein [Ureaplasma sp. ES3154-GEN]|uniref:PstS family phosphate ABC transporter substrate-binding protein n=1 Tax=Ureaplasma sp. ES3154-GEN TaxID=2984844 RepID=UPI0021E6FA0F|nr:PstS family phosphate ABC transporter substrate-binding protein [Ureaplasma sp. ES3154-GEN]MCV3743376.1 PstS family phosphate ABC transporter substrate-binding protein [Ureaplasma sp. ES3154-GEN]